MVTVQQHPECARRDGVNEGLEGHPLPVVAVQTAGKWKTACLLTAPSSAIQPSVVSWNLFENPY